MRFSITGGQVLAIIDRTLMIAFSSSISSSFSSCTLVVILAFGYSRIPEETAMPAFLDS